MPAQGVLEYRVLGTNFRDYAVVFTQLEHKDEAFSTVELYSAWPGRGAVLPVLPVLPVPPPCPPAPGRLSGGLPTGRTQQASLEAVTLFTKWSRGLGFLSQQQARLQADRECHPVPLSVLGTFRESGRTGGRPSRSHLLPVSQACRAGPASGQTVSKDGEAGAGAAAA